MNYFREFLPTKEPKKKPSLNIKFLRLFILLHVGKHFYLPNLFKSLPKLKKTVWVFENYTLQKIKTQKKDIYKDLDSFYSKHDLDSKIKNGSIWEELE
jgi:hypothetical protein